MLQIKFKEQIEKLLSNLDKVPDEFFVRTDGGKYEVIWFMDRQRPSVESSYDFDMERFGITKDGKVIWGFDSGCSCPIPWSQSDYGDHNYFTKTWKEFEVFSKDKEALNENNRYKVENWFDETWDEECYNNLKDYTILTKDKIDPLEVLDVKNAEIRRYLMKRIGFENIKNNVNTKVIHEDGTSQLLEINEERYVKVKDSSTDREYLLYVEKSNQTQTCKGAIAWTFGLTESEYNPLIET